MGSWISRVFFSGRWRRSVKAVGYARPNVLQGMFIKRRACPPEMIISDDKQYAAVGTETPAEPAVSQGPQHIGRPHAKA